MTIFERRHYQAIAEVLRVELKIEPNDPFRIEEIIRSFADMFSRDNPNFKRERFLKACGMED